MSIKKNNDETEDIDKNSEVLEAAKLTEVVTVLSSSASVIPLVVNFSDYKLQLKSGNFCFNCF